MMKINGRRASEAVLSRGITDYRSRYLLFSRIIMKTGIMNGNTRENRLGTDRFLTFDCEIQGEDKNGYLHSYKRIPCDDDENSGDAWYAYRIVSGGFILVQQPGLRGHA